MIPDNDPVRLLNACVEGMDLSELYKTYTRVPKNLATPKQLFKIVVYAAMNGIYSSRKIDMTMGTSQMLSCMEERIHDLNADIEVTCFGQEFNPSTFAIAKADMMIWGGDPNNMRFGDTLSDDQFKGYTFQYCIGFC